MTLQVRHIFRITLLGVAAVVSSVATSEACVCVGEAPAACELYKRADVAFVGRATEVPPNRAAGRVRFRLTQALKGVAGSEVSALNEESGAGCGYQFEQGEEYVVFATRTADGDIEIARCSSTIWMVRVPDFAYQGFRRRAAEAVAFAASLLKPASGGRIFGEVSVRVPFSAPDDETTTAVDGATVILRGSGQERRTPSVKGRYEFTGLPIGSYTVSVIMPDGLPPARSARPPEHSESHGGFSAFSSLDFTRTIKISDARGCGYAPFETEFDGEIVGTVVRHDGGQIKGLSVYLFPATIDPQQQEFFGASVETDAQGAYRFSTLPPGRYVIAINPRDEPSDSMPFPATYYRDPGNNDPAWIEIGHGTHVDVGALRLPVPPAKYQIGGTVAWSDGRPLANVQVEACDDRPGRLGQYCRTSSVTADGGFSVAVFGGRTYNVTADAADPRGWWDKATTQRIPPIGTAEVTVRVDREVRGLRLVLVPR